MFYQPLIAALIAATIVASAPMSTGGTLGIVSANQPDKHPQYKPLYITIIVVGCLLVAGSLVTMAIGCWHCLHNCCCCFRKEQQKPPGAEPTYKGAVSDLGKAAYLIISPPKASHLPAHSQESGGGEMGQV
ncbi:hypothetical protein F4810DRAFT_662808 [Camillea tinctor]|nr:hypothetical protein F4810DRAFT_662808 [Camillea tinctor]